MANSNPMELNEVIRSICRHLSFKDLLTCSELSKSWNYECRVQLRDHRKVCANLTYSGSCCKSLKWFNNCLHKMSIVPFTGIFIKLEGDDVEDVHGRGNSSCSRLRNIEIKYKNILTPPLFRLKRLSIDCSSLTEACRELVSLKCHVARLVINLLKSHGETLEYLEIDWVPNGATLLPVGEPVVSAHPPRIHLPNLKNFQCYAQEFRESPVSLVLEILQMAPNLVHLNVETDARLLEMLPHEAFKIVRRLQYSVSSVDDVEIYGKFAAADPELTTLDGIFDFNFPDLGAAEAERMNALEKFWDYLLRIVRSSADTLESLQADPTLMAMLAITDCPPLPKVNHIYLEMPWDSAPLDAVFALLRRVDYDHLFPSLKRLELMADFDYYYHFEQQEFFRRFDHFPPPIHAVNSKITEIQLQSHGLDAVMISHLVNLFPRVTKFISWGRDPVVDFPQIWSILWPALRKLQIAAKLEPINLDAVFCGLSAEEATNLGQESDEFLEHVKIVAVAPAIDRLKELQRLRIWLRGKPEKVVEAENAGISRVTALLMLRRMPKLKIDFVCHDSALKKRLDHLKCLKQVTVNASLSGEDSDVD